MLYSFSKFFGNPNILCFLSVILDVSVMLHHTSHIHMICIIVRCPEGMQGNTAKDDCELCAVGTYSDSVTADNETCTMCPAEHTTSAAGSKNASDCFCKCQGLTHYNRKDSKSSYLPNTLQLFLTTATIF